jgi:hypothetical protein
MSDGEPSRATFACDGRMVVTVDASGIGRVARETFAGSGQSTSADHHVEYL